jgi:hypothetical protein
LMGSIKIHLIKLLPDLKKYTLNSFFSSDLPFLSNRYGSESVI